MSNDTRFEEDCLQEYLGDIADHRVLTREEEIELFQRHEAGEASARDEIITCNLRLVVKIALAFKGNGLPVADLIQEGNIGLLHVVDKFDWRKGFRFSTYAAFWIRQEIQAALRNTGAMIRLPVRKSRLLSKISEAIRSFSFMEGRDPSHEEIAAILGEDVEKIKMLMPMRETIYSLDAEVTEDGSTLMQTLPCGGASPDAKVAEAETVATVRKSFDQLSDREREIVEYRFGFRSGGSAMSLRKTSAKVGLSQEGVRRVERRALDKLRRPGVADDLRDLLIA